MAGFGDMVKITEKKNKRKLTLTLKVSNIVLIEVASVEIVSVELVSVEVVIVVALMQYCF